MRVSAAAILVVTFALSGALAAAACGTSTGRDATPTVAATPSSTPTVAASPTPLPEEAVRIAYLAYWDAYSSALLNLDATRVEGVASGDELQRIKDEVDLLRSQRVAARVVIEHDFAVVQVADRAATVVDRFVDRSFYVDPVTRQPPQGSGEGKVVMDTFQLERSTDSRWFVIRSTRQR